MRWISVIGLVAVLAAPAEAGRLFVGLEGSAPPTKSSDLTGFPNVTWDSHFAFDVSGAAATPDGEIYLCNGAFTTRLYRATLESDPVLLATISVDLHALAYGNGTLWGYSNFSDPKGIYAVDPTTGQATLVLDVYTGTGFRFFGLDYNPADGLLYGYTEYGTSGLYSINLESGEMIRVVGPIPAANSQGRGLAVGDDVVYLTATRGDDGIPLFAYDLSQGPNGDWVGFTNPYPEFHSTGGAAWMPTPVGVGEERPGPGDHPSVEKACIESISPNPSSGATCVRWQTGIGGPILLEILTAAGRTVARLEDGWRPAGHHPVVWNGLDADGRAVPAGVYFARLEAGPTVVSRRIVIVR